MGLAYRAAHRVVANSTAAAGMLEDEGVPAAKIMVISNGIDLDRFTRAAPAPPTGRTIIATVANLRPGKGHDVLLRAFAAVVSQVPDARLRLVGSGVLRAPLERLAADLGVARSIEFLGHCENVQDVLSASHLYAFPSWTEAFPNGLIEGMAAGLPVVASGTGGMVELVEHGVNGLLVPPGDADALATALLALMRTPDLADRLGSAARSTIETRYSFDRMIREFDRLYGSASNGSPSRCVA